MSKIWEPKNYKKSNLYHFESFLKKEFKKSFLEYSEMHNWSINQPDQFWLAISKFFKIEFSKSYKSVLIQKKPFYKSVWFENSKLSYCNHLLRHAKKGEVAIIYKNEKDNLLEISWNSLLKRSKEIRSQLIKNISLLDSGHWLVETRR